MIENQHPTIPPLTLKQVFSTWWPLAASWLLMGMEAPILSAFVARLADPEIHLAAYSGVVFPLALIVESPIIMLLAASTALSKDWDAYQRVRTYMMWAGGLLTLLHVLLAFTPLYDVVVVRLMRPPTEIIEPARLGLKIMTPWTWSIAYRRFNQGVLIRFGHSRSVGIGTVIRLSADVLVLILGFVSGNLSGIVVATSAVAMGVICEALYVGITVQPVLREELRPMPKVEPALTWRGFAAFYLPLVMTSLLTLLANPIGSAAISRMPEALNSLAVWLVLTGLVFMTRSLGIAYNEVVVALLDKPLSSPSLRCFSALLASGTTLLIFLIAATPLSEFWFARFSGLSPELVLMAKQGIWYALPLPALSVLQSWYQGSILYGQHTRGITESVVMYLITSILVLGAGILWGKTAGLYVGMLALSLSVFTQTLWLAYRSQDIRRAVSLRDTRYPAPLA